MSKKKTTMEINGRVYDAKSGHVLKVEKSKKTVVNHKTIDGFVKNSAPLDLSKSKKAVVARKKTTVASKSVHRKQSATKRLHPIARDASKAKAKSPQIKKFAERKTSLSARQQRAASTKRSKQIKRHSYRVTEKQAQQAQAKPKQDMAPPMPTFTRKARFTPQKPQPQKVQGQQQDDNQISWVRKHLVPAAAAFSGLALLSGFLIYNSLPNLTMRVAASRAGFDAGIPSYQPSGYSFEGPTSYGPGRVVISFQSKTDDRNYTITQRQSSWDSQSLLENFVGDRSENHVVFEEHGLTIYLYDKDKATWVDGGIWYQVEGSANLSSEQILKIAASM